MHSIVVLIKFSMLALLCAILQYGMQALHTDYSCCVVVASREGGGSTYFAPVIFCAFVHTKPVPTKNNAFPVPRERETFERSSRTKLFM